MLQVSNKNYGIEYVDKLFLAPYNSGISSFFLMKINIFDIKLLIIVILFMKGSLVLSGY